jgi:hypothetical protein
MTRKWKIITILSLLLVLILFSLILHVNYSRTISPQNIKIGELTESIESIKLSYNVKSITVKYHRGYSVHMNLYFRHIISPGMERDIFLECAKAITDPATLVLFKEKYLYRVDISAGVEENWQYDLNPENYDENGYPFFDIVISFHLFNDANRKYYILHRFESIGGEGNENYEYWVYENNITRESYFLTLSEMKRSQRER